MDLNNEIPKDERLLNSLFKTIEYVSDEQRIILIDKIRDYILKIYDNNSIDYKTTGKYRFLSILNGVIGLKYNNKVKYEVAEIKRDDKVRNIYETDIVMKILFNIINEYLKSKKTDIKKYTETKSKLPNSAHLYYVHHGYRSLFSILKVRNRLEMIPRYEVNVNIKDPSFEIGKGMIEYLKNYKFEYNGTKKREINDLGIDFGEVATITIGIIEKENNTETYEIDRFKDILERKKFDIVINKKESIFNIFKDNFDIYYKESLSKGIIDNKQKSAIEIHGGNTGEVNPVDEIDQNTFEKFMFDFSELISRNNELIPITNSDIKTKIEYNNSGQIIVFIGGNEKYKKKVKESIYTFLWFILVFSNGVNLEIADSIWNIYWRNNFDAFIVNIEKFLEYNKLGGYIESFRK